MSQTTAKYEPQQSPDTQQFAEGCLACKPCSIDNLASFFNVYPHIINQWLNQNAELLELYKFYAYRAPTLEAMEYIISLDNVKENKNLHKEFIRRNEKAKEFGFITDLELKNFEPASKINLNGAEPSKQFFPQLNPVYYDLLNVASRYVILYGGAGSGKSYAVVDWLLFKIYNSRSPIRILYGRKNFAHIKQSQFALFKARIAHYNLADDFLINKTDYQIVCKKNNAALIAIGLDDPEKIKSIYDPIAVWIEEATELNHEDYSQLDLRLRSNLDNLQVIFTFNPISKKHWLRSTFIADIDVPMGEPVITKHNIIVDEVEIPLETYILKTNYKHNKHLPTQYIAALEKMKTLNPEYYNIYVNAEWGDAGQGWLFKRDYFDEYNDLPSDVRGIVYCDPNLSKKNKGDTTAICKLLFSPSTQLYYVEDVICQSYDDANVLLRDLFNLYHNDQRLIGLAFDGNVSQESQWTQHVRNFAINYNTPVPIIDYKHYNVDDLAKNASIIWAEGRIKFRAGIRHTRSGEEFLGQLYSFTGKKNSKSFGNRNNKDDAPDSLICSIQALFERGYRLSNAPISNIKGLV